jgi:LacI family gluconate utilization system Gnt-I transcriptional repressor
MVPALTTVRTPRSEIGEAGARMLLALMRGDKPQPSCVRLGYEVVPRQST